MTTDAATTGDTIYRLGDAVMAGHVKTCECGCGQPTPLATKTDARWDRVKGQPLRFLHGHNGRVATDRAAKVEPDARRCRKCTHPLVSQKDTPPPGVRKHSGRGLCVPCHSKASRTDELLDFERRTRSRDDVLDDWVLLRGEGHTRAQAAERIGMSPEAFARALQRAARDGDPRALPANGDTAAKVARAREALAQLREEQNSTRRPTYPPAEDRAAVSCRVSA